MRARRSGTNQGIRSLFCSTISDNSTPGVLGAVFPHDLIKYVRAADGVDIAFQSLLGQIVTGKVDAVMEYTGEGQIQSGPTLPIAVDRNLNFLTGESKEYIKTPENFHKRAIGICGNRGRASQATWVRASVHPACPNSSCQRPSVGVARVSPGLPIWTISWDTRNSEGYLNAVTTAERT